MIILSTLVLEYKLNSFGYKVSVKCKKNVKFYCTQNSILFLYRAVFQDWEQSGELFIWFTAFFSTTRSLAIIKNWLSGLSPHYVYKKLFSDPKSNRSYSRHFDKIYYIVNISGYRESFGIFLVIFFTLAWKKVKNPLDSIVFNSMQKPKLPVGGALSDTYRVNVKTIFSFDLNSCKCVRRTEQDKLGSEFRVRDV